MDWRSTDALQAVDPDDDLFPEAGATLARTLEVDLPVPATPLSLEEIRRVLTERVSALLDRHPERLMSILYRVDVAERDVQRVFRVATHDTIPEQLADLLLTRQLQKLRTRRAYRSAP